MCVFSLTRREDLKVAITAHCRSSPRRRRSESSAAYEMYVAGYTFKVLNNAFMNHWGLQKRETRPRWRQLQHFLNNRLFKGFAKEISARYNRDPYNMLEKIELPGFWGVKNASDINMGVPGQADINEIYKQD